MLAAVQARTPESDQALEVLCRTYWFPLYAYIRRQGHSREDAEDLTQAFFERLLEKKDFGSVHSQRGRFRAFLLASVKHFLINEWKKAHRQKRGGAAVLLSLDWQSADTRFHGAAASDPSPDQAFDQEWALALLGKVIGQLKVEWEKDGRGRQFNELKIFLTLDKGAVSYAEASKALDLDEGAVRVIVHRMRKRYRELLREEICQTLTDSTHLEDEMHALFGAFS